MTTGAAVVVVATCIDAGAIATSPSWTRPTGFAAGALPVHTIVGYRDVTGHA
jgi:hypothetical protein